MQLPTAYPPSFTTLPSALPQVEQRASASSDIQPKALAEPSVSDTSSEDGVLMPQGKTTFLINLLGWHGFEHLTSRQQRLAAYTSTAITGMTAVSLNCFPKHEGTLQRLGHMAVQVLVTVGSLYVAPLLSVKLEPWLLPVNQKATPNQSATDTKL
ncbi:MAG: hypothetical protein ACKO34_04650 [Vampirovibrionales bacterium]